MKFYNREKEIAELRRLDALAEHSAQLTVLMGRRRTGKTTLMTHALFGQPYLYFFVGKKAEKLQCADFQKQVESVLGLHIHGQANSVAAILEELMIYAHNTKVTLIIDEFQRLADIDEGIISNIQNVWDKYHEKSHIHLIACGSIYSMMRKIFEYRR